MLETAWESRWLPDYNRAYSSAGYSARLISVRSVVRVHLSPLNAEAFILYLENCILENTNIFITQKIQDIRDKNQEMFVNANET